MTETEKKNVFLTLHKNFVRTDIELSLIHISEPTRP